ncbi:uncharacterized protein BJ212DRAFT_1282769 [Suillus subaureus]|uniref:GAG-pre-integrase domain-containing protein n=1 Tax=Suillus subaureus TaxID=48587 RepID=A0A9P7DYC3_9AGAM|nr:uncharacterized protein BJ212DRAFT_1282769 [Suillus subaureus]KAG1806167.1 hypothetical protein BJ212DRAFT_1282769 [Suillus subaureus]
MTGNLFFVDLKFIHPNTTSLNCAHQPPHEISAFVHLPLLLDLWHARMGHPGGDAIKHLGRIATGIKLDTTAPLQCCKPCIMAKHLHKPYPPSKEPCANQMLDLVHSDLCGPFPVATPDGKLHFSLPRQSHKSAEHSASCDQRSGS